METSDDAAVYQLNETQAVIQTLDFFTPVVDDPYMYGQIAAANALSDVYAMGGTPTLALNIVCFPKQLDIEILGEILRGGAEKVKEAGALLVGGHSIQDDEPKYGLSVMGVVSPDKILKNVGARPGDVLILTKAIGTGILNTCIGEDLLSETQYQGLISSMAELNKNAALPLDKFSVSACTDITGFGLIGHLAEMIADCRQAEDGTGTATEPENESETESETESGVYAEIYFDQIPILSGAVEFATMGIIPGGTYRNSAFSGKKASLSSELPDYAMDLLFDPQTSGGLLISIPEAESEALMQIYRETLNQPFALIGKVKKRTESIRTPIIVLPRR